MDDVDGALIVKAVPLLFGTTDKLFAADCWPMLVGS